MRNANLFLGESGAGNSNRAAGKTGVEMEALTGASVAALTVYDMCKAVDPNMIISELHVIKKTGGKSDINIC